MTGDRSRVTEEVPRRIDLSCCVQTILVEALTLQHWELSSIFSFVYIAFLTSTSQTCVKCDDHRLTVLCLAAYTEANWVCHIFFCFHINDLSSAAAAVGVAVAVSNFRGDRCIKFVSYPPGHVV